MSSRVVSRANRRTSRVGPPPQFKPNVDAWSVSPVWQQSTSVWDLQWICVSCSRHIPAGDIPSCPQVPCGVCADPAHVVMDFRMRGGIGAQDVNQTRVESSPQEVRRDVFSHASCQSGSIAREGELPITVPGPQSWLICPITSLALAVVERARSVTPFSTGPRSAVPLAQQQYWMTHAAAIVDSLASHFQSLPPSLMSRKSCRVSPLGLVVNISLRPRTRILCSTICVGFPEHMFGDPMRIVREWTTSGSVTEVPSPSPFVNMQVETPLTSPRSPFQNAGHNPVETSGPGSPIVVSHPFAMPVAAEPHLPQSLFQFPVGGPVRLTRFVEMPFDVYYARVNGMIQSGFFFLKTLDELHTVRLEGGTAWGVWLRINHWSTAFGSKASIEMWGPLSFGQRDSVIPWHCR